MKLHYFVKQTPDGRFQAQESQESYGGEHDHPAEIEDGVVVTYATVAAAGYAALRAANEAQCSPDGRRWTITCDRHQVGLWGPL